MSLYTVDRPMQVNDYQEGLIRSKDSEATFLKMLRDGKRITQWTSSWAVKSFAKRRDPVGAEGADKTSGWGKKTPTELNGSAEVFVSEGWLVTEEAEAMPAGYDSKTGVEAARQRLMDGQDLLLSIESILLSDQEAVEYSSGVNRRTRGAFKWLDPTQGSFQPVPAAVRPSAAQFFTGAFAAYDEDAFKAQIKAAAIQKNRPVNLMGACGMDLKDKLSMFNIKVPVTANIADTRSVNSNDGVFKMVVDIFQYDGGTVRTYWQPGLLPDRTDATEFVDGDFTSQSGLFLDMEMWAMNWLLRVKHYEVQNNGGGKRGFHKGTGRLQCLNPMGQFAVKPTS